MNLPDGIGDLQIRAYFASVVGAFRAPFGRRGAQPFNQIGQVFQLVQNSTRSRVLSVVVSRSDLGGAAATALFSQQSLGGSSDFPVTFTPVAVFRFVLYPDDILTLTMTGGGPMNVVIGQEAY